MVLAITIRRWAADQVGAVDLNTRAGLPMRRTQTTMDIHCIAEDRHNREEILAP